MSQVAAVAANAPMTQQTVDSILTQVVSQYDLLRKIGDDGMVPERCARSMSTVGDDLGSLGTVNKGLCTHSISELLLILADLTSTVPGRPPIHKFHLLTGTQVAVGKARESTEHSNPFTSAVLLKHAVTGGRWCRMFVTFGAQPRDPGHHAPLDAGSGAGGPRERPKPKPRPRPSTKGKNLRDAAVYFVRPVISRATGGAACWRSS